MPKTEVKKKYVPPKTLGACADRLFELKELRAKAQKAVDALTEETSSLKTHIIETLPKSETSGVAGRKARVTVVTKQVPQVKDWAKLQAYVKKHDAWDLLGRSLNNPAIGERWDSGKKVPGVEAFTAVTVSLNKL